MWSEEGKEKFTISLKNVKVIGMDIQRSEVLPDLMSPCDPGIERGSPMPTIPEAETETRQEATLVEIQAEDEEQGSSPEDDSENSTIRYAINCTLNISTAVYTFEAHTILYE